MNLENKKDNEMTFMINVLRKEFCGKCNFVSVLLRMKVFVNMKNFSMDDEIMYRFFVDKKKWNEKNMENMKNVLFDDDIMYMFSLSNMNLHEV